MIFQHSWQAILEGRKTQTRRLVVPELDTLQNGAVIRCGEPPRVRWAVGKDYAVQPGRGKKALHRRLAFDGNYEYSNGKPNEVGPVRWHPVRIRILSIRREDVREISDADVKAEGFDSRADFMITWVKMHDKSVITPIIPDYNTGLIMWNGMSEQLATRPAERYDAWALTFEVVK